MSSDWQAVLDGREPSYSKAEMARAAGITARQADYWLANQWIMPLARQTENPKSRLVFDGDELEVAELMGALVRMGLAEHLGARLAREHIEEGVTEFKIGKGVMLSLGDVL